MRTKTRTLAGALVALAVGLSSCGSNGHVTSGNSPGDTSSWPATLSNTKVAALYDTANSSSTTVDCVPAGDPVLKTVTQSHVDSVGGTSGGPAQSELVTCYFETASGHVDVFLGPVGASTWTNPQDLTDPSALREAKVIPGSGTLSLPYTQPGGWRWQLSYDAPGLSPAAGLQLAHAVADNLAH